MSWDNYSQTPASNDLSGYFQTGMAPSKVKNAGWDIMADLAQFMSLPTSAGTANAQTVTNTRQFGALFTGMRQSFIPGNTNTGAVTLAIDGLTAKNVFANGVAAIAGMLVSGTVAHVQYDGTQFQLLNPQRSSGTATVTQTGYASPPTGTLNYEILQDGKTVYWWTTANISGTSSTAAMTWTGIPSIIQPITAKGINYSLTDSGTNTIGSVSIAASSGTWTFGKAVGSAGGDFTASGTKRTLGLYEYSHTLT